MQYDFENINRRFGIGSKKWQEMKNNPLIDKKVIPFSVADMEFKLAPEITEGLKSFIDKNVLGYAGTNKKYRKAVCTWQQKHHSFTKCERKASKFIYGDISSLKNNDSISLFFYCIIYLIVI